MHTVADGTAIAPKWGRFWLKSARFVLILTSFLGLSVPFHAQETHTVAIHLDPAGTTVGWTLNSMLHKVHGSFKLKGGEVVVNAETGLAQGEILVDATTGSSGNASRDARWHKDVLESRMYPAIIFHPTALAGLHEVDGSQQVKATGTMTVLGKDHAVELLLTVEVHGKDVTVSTHFDVPYVQWGLKQATAGLVRYDKQAAIDIHAQGTLTLATARPAASVQ